MTKKTLIRIGITGGVVILISLLFYLFNNIESGTPAKGIVQDPPPPLFEKYHGIAKCYKRNPPIIPKAYPLLNRTNQCLIPGQKIWVKFEKIDGKEFAIFHSKRKPDLCKESQENKK